MLLALGAASSVWDALQSLTSSSKASSVQTSSSGQTATSPFDISGGAGAPTGGASSIGASGGLQISPQTMSALIAAQSQSGASSTAPTDPSRALQDLFSQIDGNGDGAITKQEFEDALGAGGTNLAAADDVFSKLDRNGDGSVSLDELKQALQGAGRHGHHHHMHAGGTGDSDGANSTDPTSSTDPLLAALAGASSTSATNADGSTTTSITYADGSKVSLTTPAASTSSTSSASSAATSSYNLIEQLIQREAQALSTSISGAVSVSA
jgi:Ca2+-binding EF-hand superfamily protein